MSKTYNLALTKESGSVENIPFTIPEVAGTYRLNFNLASGATINAGNIVVGNQKNNYHLTLNKGSGASISVSGNITTPMIPFYLSISRGANSTIVVSRTSSPNAGAATGNLANGAEIFYGDVLNISFSASSGYNVSTHTVNGTTFTSGSEYTVTSDVSVVSTAVSAASWHTKFTGDHSVAAILERTATIVSVNVNGEDIGEVVVLGNGHTRISGNVLAYDADGIQTTENFTNITIWSEDDVRLLRIAYDTTASYYANCYVYTDSSGEVTEAFNFQLNRGSGQPANSIIPATLHITKVEQYY